MSSLRLLTLPLAGPLTAPLRLARRDTLRLDTAGTYNLSLLTAISNIDVIAFNQNAANFNLILGSQIFTPDANGDGIAE